LTLIVARNLHRINPFFSRFFCEIRTNRLVARLRKG